MSSKESRPKARQLANGAAGDRASGARGRAGQSLKFYTKAEVAEMLVRRGPLDRGR
jgi:hypothetical protein